MWGRGGRTFISARMIKLCTRDRPEMLYHAENAAVALSITSHQWHRKDRKVRHTRSGLLKISSRDCRLPIMWLGWGAISLAFT